VHGTVHSFAQSRGMAWRFEGALEVHEWCIMNGMMEMIENQWHEHRLGVFKTKVPM